MRVSVQYYILRILKHVLKLCLLLTFHAEPTNAQQSLNSFLLNSDNGLAQNSVWDVITDKEGFLWIGTANGLNRWDGINITHYYPGNKTHSFNGLTGFSFFADDFGYTWIAHNNGLSYYNHFLDSFFNIVDTTFTPCILGAYKQKLFVITNPNRITVINLNNRLIEEFIEIKGSNVYNPVAESNKSVVISNFAICTLSVGKIMLFNMNDKKYNFIYVESDLSKPIKLSNNAAIITNLYTTYKFTLQKDTLVWHKIVNTKQAKTLIMAGVYWNNKFLLASLEGIFSYDTAGFFKLNEFKIKNHDLSNNIYDNFYIDARNNLYICTNVSGLHIVSYARNKFKQLKTNSSNLNMVKSILVTSDDKIFTGQYGSHLVQYINDEMYDIINFHNKPYKAVWGMCNIDKDNLLAVGFNSLFVYNHNKKKLIKTIPFSNILDNQYPVFFHYDSVIVLNININTTGSLYKFYVSDYSIKKIQDFNDKLITAFYIINNEKMFVGSRMDLWLYNKNANKSVKLLNGWIKHISVFNTDTFLVATTNGLFMINAFGRLLKTYNTENGLKDNFVYSALVDADRNIWISTNKGIGVIEKKNEIHWYTLEDGLQSNEFNTGAFTLHKGNLYFGGVNGINIINPTYKPKNYVVTNTAITNILVNDLPYKLDSAVNAKMHLVLEYTNNTLSFDFASLDFSFHTKNTYRYFFEGIEKSWIDLSEKHFIRYAQLQPGNYKLMVQSAGYDGIYGATKTIFITIKPPFWLTWWFKVVIVLMFILVIAAILYLYQQRLKNKAQMALEMQKKVEEERLRISRDLHDNVGAHLSYVVSAIDLLVKENSSNSTFAKRLQLTKDAGQQAIQTLRETIWAVNQNEVAFEALVDRIKQYAIKILQTNEQIKIDFNEEINHHTALTPTIALNLFRTAQEAFHNALKHSKCNIISIYFEVNQSVIKIVIADNGCGFDTNKTEIENHYGLANMKARMAEIGGQISFESNFLGTKVIIALDLNKNK
jgi:signal transduction histidine kinase/ligand-binding sensor domain-containing protein